MSTAKERLDRLIAERDMTRNRLAQAEANVAAARAMQTDIDVVMRTIQYIAARVQTGFGNYIGGLVTKAMHYVFPDRRDDAFVVRFRENNCKTEAQLLLITKNGDESHPFHCAGGGLWDVLSFALLCSVIVLEQPQPSRVIILDEPFKFLHGLEARCRALRMMVNTCRSLGITAIVVHQSDVADEEIDRSLDSITSSEDCATYLVRKVGYERSVIERVTA